MAKFMCICMCQLVCSAGAKAVSIFRRLQKRFVVYDPSKAAPRPTAAAGQPQSGPDQIMEPSSCHLPGTAKGSIVLYENLCLVLQCLLL